MSQMSQRRIKIELDKRIKDVSEVYGSYNVCKDNIGKFGYFPKTHYAIADLNLSEYGKLIGIDDDGLYRYVTQDGKVDSSMYYIPELNLK